MKEHIQEPGVRKYAGDDLIELQSEPLNAIQTMFKEYPSCVVQGCEVEAVSEGKYSIKTGMLSLKGVDEKGAPCHKLALFEGVEDVMLPAYFTLASETHTRIYGDGKAKPIAHTYKAVISSVQPTSGEYLKITATGSLRLVDVMGISEKLKAAGGQAKDVVVNYTAASERTLPSSGASLGILLGRITKWLSDLKGLAFKDNVAKGDLDADLTSELDNKVVKVNGKGLSANDYTTAEKTKLADLDAASYRKEEALWNGGDNPIDPDTVTSGLALCKGATCPIPDTYYYITTLFYNGRSGSRAQIAVRYAEANEMWIRNKYDKDAWSPWVRLATTELLASAVNEGFSKTKNVERIIVGGDINTFYPVLFSVPSEGFNRFVIQRGAHLDQSDKGNLRAVFEVGSCNWTDFPTQFKCVFLRQLSTKFIANYETPRGANRKAVVYLRGATSYDVIRYFAPPEKTQIYLTKANVGNADYPIWVEPTTTIAPYFNTNDISLLTSADTIVANGGNADTLGGKAPSYFAKDSELYRGGDLSGYSAGGRYGNLQGFVDTGFDEYGNRSLINFRRNRLAYFLEKGGTVETTAGATLIGSVESLFSDNVNSFGFVNPIGDLSITLNLPAAWSHMRELGIQFSKNEHPKKFSIWSYINNVWSQNMLIENNTSNVFACATYSIPYGVTQIRITLHEYYSAAYCRIVQLHWGHGDSPLASYALPLSGGEMYGSCNWKKGELKVANKPVIVEGDARLTDARNPKTHAHAIGDLPAYPTLSSLGAAAATHKHTKGQITDFPTSLPANGGNADTLDGKHASDFQNKVARHSPLSSTNADTTRDSLILTDTGTPAAALYYVQTLFYDNTSSSRMQIATKYTGIGMWTRHASGSGNYSAWSPWVRIIDANMLATPSANGLMTSTDKTKVNSLFKVVCAGDVHGTGNIASTWRGSYSVTKTSVGRYTLECPGVSTDGAVFVTGRNGYQGRVADRKGDRIYILMTNGSDANPIDGSFYFMVVQF